MVITGLSFSAIAQLNGNYTVGGATPDYPNVTAAVADLNAKGVSGPVTFDIRPGTYTGQVVINSISGASNANRITFQSENGNRASVVIRFGPTSTSNNYIIRLNNASYITIKDLTVTTTSTSRGRLIEFRSNASYNTVHNCALNAVGTSSNMAGIYGTSLRGTDNTFTNNYFNRGYYGIYFRGSSSSTSNATKNTIIENNEFDNVWYYSNYLYYQRGLKFNNNSVKRTGSGTHYGARIYDCDASIEVTNNEFELDGSGTRYGIYGYYNDGGCDFVNNKITITNASTAYGFRFQYNDGTSSNYNNIINNVIAIENGSSTAYGIYDYYGRYQYIFNNSVNINSSSTSAQAGRFYYSSSSYRYNIIRNNVLSNYGNGIAMYVYRVNYNNTWDYNNLYTNGTKLVETGSPSGSYNDLNSWRNAQSQDMNSISYNPGFKSNMNLLPDVNNSASWSLNGRGVHMVSNNIDFDGNSRITQLADGAPDIGAYEFEPAVQPPLATAIPSNAVPGTIQEFYFGENLVATIKWNDDLKITSPLEVRQYSGRKAPAFNYNNFMYFYTDIEEQGNSSTYNFDAEVNYMDIWLGTMPGENDIRLAHQYKNSNWIGYVSPKSSINTAGNIIKAQTVTSFGKFTGTIEGDIHSAYITPGGSTVICIGNSVLLTANNGAGYTYKWKRNGVEIQGATMQTYTASTPGDYSVEVTDGSAVAESIPVTVSTIAPPNAPVSTNSNPTYCIGNGLTLSTQTGNGLTYQWKLDGYAIPGATASTYAVNASGNYTVVVENIGCATESKPQPVTAGPLNVDLGADISVCEQKGFPLDLDAGYPGATYTWSTGATSQKITVNQSGTYVVRVDAGPNCIDEDTIVIDVDPLPSANGISYVKNGNSYLFSPSSPQDVDGYMWIFGDGTTSTQKSVTKTINGDLYVRLVLYNTCGTDTLQIGWALSVGEVVLGESINVYPNPARDNITVKPNGDVKVEELYIINNLGAVVLKQKATPANNEQTVNISNLPAGYYILRLSTENGIINKPFNIVR